MLWYSLSVEKQNKAMKMFCNKRFLEAGKLMMFRDVRAVGTEGLGERGGGARPPTRF